MSEFSDTSLLTLDDLKSCGWEEVLSRTPEITYLSLGSAFLTSINERPSIRENHKRALHFLSDLCSMMLSVDNYKEPFGPAYCLVAGHSFFLSDITEHQLGLITDFLPSVNDLWLKGRLAHVLWIGARPRDTQFALSAIDCYRQLPLTTTSWIQGGRATWSQAIMLCKILDVAAANRLEEIEHLLVDTILSSTLQGEIPTPKIASLLRKNKLGREHASQIADWFSNAAGVLVKSSDFINAANYYDHASKWYDIADNSLSKATMNMQKAEAYVLESEKRLRDNPPSAIAAASRLRDAIQAYRQIPKEQRQQLRIDNRIDELRALLSSTEAKAVDEFRTSEVTTDVSDTVIRVQDQVRGTDIQTALKRFAAMVTIPTHEQVVAGAEAIAKQTLYTKFAGVSYMSSDGRLVGRRAPSGLASNPEGTEGIEDDTFRYYQDVISWAGACIVDPARSAIAHEHKLTEQYFIGFAAHAPLVPTGRAAQFGKGLFAGFGGDYISAAHLLIPQIEHSIRLSLSSAGLETTSLLSSGIERHKPLNEIVRISEAEDVFGKDLLEMLKALLCDPNGEGLRNQIAHGLIDDDDFPSETAAFLWGLSLSLAIRSIVAKGLTIPVPSESG